MKWSLASLAATAACGAWWMRNSQQRSARWLRRLVADAGRSPLPAPVTPKPGEWSDNSMTLSWLGHATVLINFYGVHILTDPAFGGRIGLDLRLGTFGPKRHIAPALRPDQLPPLDLVLLSHAHLDHLDLPSLRTLDRSIPVVTAHGTRDLLQTAPFRQITELKWDQRTTLRYPQGTLEIEAVEVKHWGQRWPNEQISRGYNGYVLRREGQAILFGGDTAHTPLFAQLRARGPFQAAIMPIGAYRPWIRNHCTPEQALAMANQAGASYIVPVHHQTFRLSDEPMTEPIERMVLALQAEPERLALQRVGESFTWPA